VSTPKKSIKPKPRKAAPKVKAVEAWACIVEGEIMPCRIWNTRDQIKNVFGAEVECIRVTIAPAKPRAKRKAVKP